MQYQPLCDYIVNMYYISNYTIFLIQESIAISKDSPLLASPFLHPNYFERGDVDSTYKK